MIRSVCLMLALGLVQPGVQAEIRKKSESVPTKTSTPPRRRGTA